MDSIANRLLAWYDRHARKLPWRVPPDQGKRGVMPDPYHVWLSEVMLQQTGVVTIRSYFEKFIETWPTVQHLADSPLEDVLKAWAGLGYYSRARNLKACADTVSSSLGGSFPQSASELQKLPGIGPYTAAAISTIAFGGTEPVVDGNIERVSTRHLADATPLPKVKKACHQFMARHTPATRPGDFVQAMMDLGATICTPRNPACSLCPIAADCRAGLNGTAMNFPVRPPRKPKPTRVGAAFVAERQDGAIWLTRRGQTGLLAGMATVPTTGWTASRDGETGVVAAPFKGQWKRCNTVRHTFTHFHLELEVWRSQIRRASGEGWWASQAEIPAEALPSLMRKVIAAAREKNLQVEPT